MHHFRFLHSGDDKLSEYCRSNHMVLKMVPTAPNFRNVAALGVLLEASHAPLSSSFYSYRCKRGIDDVQGFEHLAAACRLRAPCAIGHLQVMEILIVGAVELPSFTVASPYPFL